MPKELTLIPTRYKTKIPSFLSWSLKASELSAVLAGLPQFSQLKIHFFFYAKAAKHRPLTLLRASYTNFPPDLELRWALDVAPVPRDLRKSLHDRLVLQLPNLRDWLLMNSDRSASGTLSYEISWDEERDVLTMIAPESPETERV